MTAQTELPRTARLASMRAWNGPWAALPPAVRDHPTMLTREELRMLRWLAMEHCTGEGVICDLGSFLGGSTMALADGWLAAGREGVGIHSYDRHRIVEHRWREYVGDRLPFPEGGDFLPAMPALMQGRERAVAFHSGDFPEQPVPDAPIELLFIDIAKSAACSDKILRDYFPRLVPGRSIVIQQDYFFTWPVWDVAVMELLSDHFELLGHAEKMSAVFLLTSPIPAEKLEACMIDALTPARAAEAVLAAARRWRDTDKKLALHRILRMIELGGDAPLASRRVGPLTAALKAEPFDRARFEARFYDAAPAA